MGLKLGTRILVIGLIAIVIWAIVGLVLIITNKNGLQGVAPGWYIYSGLGCICILLIGIIPLLAYLIKEVFYEDN